MSLKLFKQEFSWQLILPNHETPNLFSASQWQTDKTKPSLIYLFYRSAYMIFFLVTIILNILSSQQEDTSWIFYLTQWGYIMINIYSILSFEIIFVSFVFTKIFKKINVAQANLKFIYRPMWVAFAIALPLSIMITNLYWAFIYKGEPITSDNVFVHATNSILMVTDLLITATPIRILQVVYPLGFAICYLIFSVIHHYIDLDNGGRGYIYHILNWSNPVSAGLVAIGVFIYINCLQLLIFEIYQLKLIIYQKINFKDQSLQTLTV